MKKLFLCVALMLSLGGVVHGFDRTQCEERDFVVTAYYSPQAGQAFYYKPDFAAEKVLNGDGTHGASGAPVFNGMLAAPATYAFGDRIYFPSLGLGKVSDRGGAIVEAGERGFSSDRIDIWMGYGEEGLVRALDFGVQRIKGYYCTQDAVSADVWKQVMQQKVGLDFSQVPLFEHFFDLAIWKQQLSFGRRDIWVRTLQKYLVKLGYLAPNKQNGSFDSVTKKALCAYQTDRLISYPAHVDCGVYGPRTRAMMKKDVENKGLLPDDLRQHASIESIKQQAVSRDVAEEIIAKTVDDSQYFDAPFNKNSFDQKVVRLQYLLEYLGHYQDEIDGVFDEETIQAVYSFQLQEEILKGLPGEEHLVGYVGPATRAALNHALQQKKSTEQLAYLQEVLEEPKKSIEPTFSFYRPYDKGEGPNAEVRILQNFLKDLDLYAGNVAGVYDKETIDAVYDFQLKYGLLSENSHYTLHGYLGPGTREKINDMLAFSAQ